VQNHIDYGTHSDHAEAFLPTGVALLKRTIDLDFQRIIPMPEAIKRTEQKEFSEYSPKGMALRGEKYSNFGFRDWYDWSCKNRGTKCNSYYGGFRNISLQRSGICLCRRGNSCSQSEIHPETEVRCHAVDERLLNITFAIRGNVLRVISARLINKREWKYYALDQK
jgi:uncharacterized DUF497 family protein